jgi:hypothetical protein
VQAHASGERDDLLRFRSVVVDRRHREDEPALSEPNPLDHHRIAPAWQYHHVTRIDVAGNDQVVHGS